MILHKNGDVEGTVSEIKAYLNNSTVVEPHTEQPINHHAPWLTDDDKHLIMLVNNSQHLSWAKIAYAMGRTVAAVMSRYIYITRKVKGQSSPSD